MATSTGLRTSYRLEIELLSPLHIGAGKGSLLCDYDFVGQRGTVWVIDQDKMLDRVGEEELLRAGSVEPRISRFLQPAQYPACARYKLSYYAEVPREILPFVKDVHARPYLPGSSLKGAIRTAIAWAAYGQAGAKLDSNALEDDRRRFGGRPDPRRADERLDRQLFTGTAPHDFRRDPNYDVMRALQVGDSASLEKDKLELAAVSLYTLRGTALQPKGQGFHWSLEVMPAGAKLLASLGVDEFVLGDRCRALGLEAKGPMVKGLAAHARAQARSTIAQEAEFYGAAGLTRLRQFYEHLGEGMSRLGEDEFLLQMAWGTGWRSKTVGSRLEEDGMIGQVRDVYRLGRTGAPFPKTRRLVERGGIPELPLGWMKVRMV